MIEQSKETPVKNIRKKIHYPIVGIVFSLITFALILIQLPVFEQEAIENLGAWAPVKYLYAEWGLLGALLPSSVIFIICLVALVNGLKKQRMYINEIGLEQFNQDLKSIRKNMPEQLIQIDNEGNVNSRTKILAVVMGVLFILIVIGLQFGFIR